MKRKSLACMLLGMLLAGCAPTARRHDYALGNPSDSPDSLKAKATFISIAPDGSEEKLSGVLFAVPGKRYRLELSASLVGAATLLWQEEAWTLLLPTEEKYLRGKGYEIRMAGTLLTGIDVRQMAGLFWGQLLPLDYQAAEKRPLPEGGFELSWEPSIGVRYLAQLDAKGWVKTVEKIQAGKPVMAVRYGEASGQEGLALPAYAVFSRDSQDFLKVEVKSVDTRAKWGSGVWRLAVPGDYRPWPGSI